jgi:hypothetical protein
MQDAHRTGSTTPGRAARRTGRRLLAVAVAVAAAAAPADGQALRGGLHRGRLADGPADWTPRSGLRLGAALGLARFGAIALVPEVHYVQTGARLPGAAGVEDPITDIRLDYIEAPVLLRVGATVPGTPGLRVHVAAGPGVLWQTGCSFGFRDGGGRSSGCGGDGLREIGLAPGLRETDWALVGAAGFDGPVRGVGRVGGEVRYQHGLTRVAPDGSAFRPRNRGLAFLLAWTP